MEWSSEKPKKKKSWIALLLIAAIVAFLCFLIFSGRNSGSIGVVKLRCSAAQSVMPFGDSVVYYDGTTIYCLNTNGTEKWNYTIGANAGISTDGGSVIAWVDNQLFIIDKNGKSTYSDHLSDEIQFARAGSKYVAAVLGDGIGPKLIMKDLNGNTVDEENLAYEDMVILDAGFFADGEYLWIIGLDVYGTVPSSTMFTMLVGQRNTGEISLGEPLVYAVKYAAEKLYVISTRQMNVYDYRGTQNKNASMLVYGWRLIDSAETGAGADLLFSPSRQFSQSESITELRLIRGSQDKRLTLPSSCVGGALYKSKIYAFSQDSIYRISYQEQRFTGLNLPISGEVTGYLGTTANGVSLLCCGMDVYAVTLP